MGAERRRILAVSPALPVPTSGFGTRVWQLLRHLSAANDVTLVSYVSPVEEGAVPQAQAVCTRLRLVDRTDTHRLRKRAAQLAAVPRPVPHAVLEHRSLSLQSALDAVAATCEFDLVQLESSRLWGLRLPAGVPVVVDEHNVEYELLRRMQDGENSAVRRAFSGIEAVKLERLERRCWSTAAGIALTSEREAAIVAGLVPGAVTEVVPNAVDTGHFSPLDRPVDPDTIVFTGLLSFRPNIDAALFLVNEVLPLVRRQVPDATVRIVGGYQSEDDVAALRVPGVEVVGWVPDMRPYLASAAVLVAPLRVGSGTRLKVLEALSMRKAMVSTAVGCEGIDVVHGEHLLVADEPPAFAAEIVRVLGDPALAARLGAAGRELVSGRYSWEVAGARLDDLHRRVLTARRPVPST
ncbi:MAG TPA: glycosyltransferase family 4 protein [Acidimicrobiales bacterium]|nr:glycosyltransferase family 4 protein [Acidimicrobiales bacterium]